MNRVDNPELTRHVLNHLANLYNIKEVREPNHLSSYVYCRTRGFFDQKQAIEPTDEEVMLFAIGYGLQDVLTPVDAKAPVLEKFGIIYRPDMIIARLTELKTTRKSAKSHYVDESVTVTWLEYMKGGCYIQSSNEYDLIVLYMMGNYSPPFPQIYCDTFTFTDEEIADNWTTIMERKAVMDRALATSQAPVPFDNCRDWECKFCRYKLVCETMTQFKEDIFQQGEEEKKLWD